MDAQVTTIVWLIVGGVAGWMAGKILKRTFWGAVGDVVVGVVGGFAGAWVWTHLNPPAGAVDQIKAIVAAAVGGIVLAVLWRVIRAMR